MMKNTCDAHFSQQGIYGTSLGQDPDPVVVTGMGLVCPLGLTLGQSWRALVTGKSGITSLDSAPFWPSSAVRDAFPSRVAGLVPVETCELGAMANLEPKKRSRVGRFIALACAATKEALEDANWSPKAKESQEVTGVIVGSGIGGLPEIERETLVLHEKGPSRISPFFIPSALSNLAAGQIAIQYGCTGPNIATVTACASGSHAIGEGAKMIKDGRADVMIVGGCEAAICLLSMSGFAQMRALSTHFNHCPEKASRPWDKDRDGFVMSEGAAILILERQSHAIARGAPIHGVVLGYGASDDAYHEAIPHESGQGARTCMSAALKDADLAPKDIGYINAHGTSTPVGDAVERALLEEMFPPGTLVSSTKSATGHSLGAAGAIEAVFCLMALKESLVPPTLNLENLDAPGGAQGGLTSVSSGQGPIADSPEAASPQEAFFVEPTGDSRPTSFGGGASHFQVSPLDFVPFQARKAPIKHVLSNSFGFGGTNASLVFGKHA